MKRTYLGDSVYAEYDGYMIRLTTENGYGPSNEIFLEPEVFYELVRFQQVATEKNNEGVSAALGEEVRGDMVTPYRREDSE